MTKLFDVAGVSRVRAGAPLKFRVANGKPARRARTLERAGCVDIQLFSIEPMSKEKALAWFQVEHPKLASQLKAKAAKAVKAEVEAAPEVPAAPVEPEVSVVDAVLSPAAKLALKRAKDALRKREKRAAEKAAREAAKASA